MKTVTPVIEDLIATYHETNTSLIEELEEEPSPLEFMRYVARNRPFVVRKGAIDWFAVRKWNAKYLTEVMDGQGVNVAITPFGNADSIITLPDGTSLFVKPYETEQPFPAILKAIQSQELSPTYIGPTHYAQTQNDNLRNEYSHLFETSQIPPSIPFARIALQKPPEAINFWLGNSKSVTALHKDPYENIYVQVIGRKHFVLLPPVEAAVVRERWVRGATYCPRSTRTQFPSMESGPNSKTEVEAEIELNPVPDKPPATLPFATWDPDLPLKNTTSFSHLSKPMRVTLEPGDMLYLPALWYHKVSQSCSDEGICCAINYWYDMEFSGSFWPMASFVREVGGIVVGTGKEDVCASNEG